MKYVILHAYSSTNSGDGLLVDEALGLIRSIDPDGEILVLALDPDSFSDRTDAAFLHPLTGRDRTPGPFTVLTAGALAVLRGLRLPREVSAVVDGADVVLGVGGGYMRGANLIEAGKMVLAHLSQLATANRRNGRSIYLPQSVGALRWGTRRAVQSHAASILWHVRDDRSLSLLDHTAVVRRTPDTAVLGFGNDIFTIPGRDACSTEEPLYGLVGRELHSTRRRKHQYVSGLRTVQSELNAELLLQARSRGNDDDRFYSAVFGRRASRSLIDGTAGGAGRRSVVVSVRLHGAIQSIRNGVPAIHLSYERKGWGAFEDLGIADYVHNAFDFDPALVIEQARHLGREPEDYWSRVSNAQPMIHGSRIRLLEDIGGKSSQHTPAP